LQEKKTLTQLGIKKRNEVGWMKINMGRKINELNEKEKNPNHEKTESEAKGLKTIV
jgi:hypothetical protein